MSQNILAKNHAGADDTQNLSTNAPSLSHMYVSPTVFGEQVCGLAEQSAQDDTQPLRHACIPPCVLNINRTSGPGLTRQEDSPEFASAARHDHVNGTAAAAPLPSPQGLLGLADLPPSTAAAAAASAGTGAGLAHYSAHSSRHPRDAAAPTVISNRASAGHGFPTDAERSSASASAGAASSNRGLPHASHHYHYHQHHFNAAAALSGRQRGMGGGGGGGPHGEDDFEFLRCILLDAGDGTAHAAHGTALRPPGSAGYLPVSTLAHAAVAATAVSNANEMGFAPISAARATSFAAASSTPQALHSTFAQPSSTTLVSGVRSFPMQAPFIGAGVGAAGAGAAKTPRDTHVGGTCCGGGGGEGSLPCADGHGPVTEEERLEAADDVARCIWLAADELRDVLLARVWGIWSTVEAEIAEESNSSAAAAAAGDRSSSPRSSPPARRRKRFNQVLVERLHATCKAVEGELEAAKANGDASALCPPPQQQWRGGAALRRDVLSRLESYQRNNKQICGVPGSGHGRFSDINCLKVDDRPVGSRLAASTESLAASGGELKLGLETALKTTRGGVKSELLMFGEDEADRNCITSVVAGSQKQQQQQQQQQQPGGGLGDRRGAAAAVGDTASVPAGGKRKKRGGGGGAAADGSGRKRKRSGNGRRCKHEGW